MVATALTVRTESTALMGATVGTESTEREVPRVWSGRAALKGRREPPDRRATRELTGLKGIWGALDLRARMELTELTRSLMFERTLRKT
jgi:hypothetical protein